MTSDQTEGQEKRTRMRGEERRALIMDRAKEVFARCGYAEASTGELARASEITEPMLYKHFGSKKGLYLAIMRESGTRFISDWRDRVMQRAEKDLMDALAHLMLEYRTALKEDPEIQKMLLSSVSGSSDPDIAGCIRTHNRAAYQFVYQLLQRAQVEGYISAQIDLNAATWGFVSMVLAKQYALILGLTGELNDDVVAEMNRLWLQALHP